MKSLLEKFLRWQRSLKPTQTLMFGYFLYIFFIFLFLSFSFAQGPEPISLIDNLFTATSAVSTTGLTSVNPAHAYNFFGQLVILIGIQIGGLGYMTLGSFAILASKRRVSKSRINIGKAVFAMPEEFKPIRFLRSVVFFSLGIELIGAIVLYYAFSDAGVENPVWAAIFHSVSAFCTAGFSVFPNNLEAFPGNWLINISISTLSLLGAIGFIVLWDISRSIMNRNISITLTSKIILTATFGALAIGSLFLFFDPSIEALPMSERIQVAFFQTMTALTTVGFNTHPLGQLSVATVVIVIVLMILGASPSGTGGGLKSTSWSAGLAAVMSFARGREEITFFGNRVPHSRINAAFAAFTLYLIAFTLGSYGLLLVDKHNVEDIIFEVASALGTVGISRGITANLTTAGKLVLVLMMYIGRLGVLSLALAAVSQTTEKTGKNEVNGDIVI